MNTNIYQRFARYYNVEQYAQFSAFMLEQFPALAQRYGLPEGGSLLEIACGNGAFTVGMAQQGWQVCGIDQSAAQLDLARQRAEDAAVGADFRQMDMRELPFEAAFDLATCWFDSINYLLNEDDWRQAFAAVYRALKPGGWYLFDMNTLYGILVRWQSFGASSVVVSTPTLLEIHRNSADHERALAHVHITIFERGSTMTGGEYLWQRMDEIHTEHALPLERVRALLTECGFTVRDVLGGLQEFVPPRADSSRAWFICQKPDPSSPNQEQA